MNILIATDTYLPYITGVSVSTDSIARFMALKGYKVTVVSSKQAVTGNVPPLKNLKIVRVPTMPFSFGNKNRWGIFPLTLPMIEKVIRDNKIDIIHIQEPSPTGLSALILAKIHKIPTVGALHFIPEQSGEIISVKHHSLIKIMSWYIQKVYNYYDAVMTVSNYFAGRLKKFGVTKPIHVISNGTDINLYKPGQINLELRKKLNINKEETVFMFLGRIDGDKNVETLVRAMPLVNNNVKLLIVGKGNKKLELKNLSAIQKTQNKIIWVDYITNEEMPKYYHAVDVFVIMSPYEGQSIVTLQAVACGLPIIAANAGALPELCHDNENGFLVSPYDYKTLAQKMNLLAKDIKLRNKFGKKSREISLPHHKPIALKKLEDIYKKLLLTPKTSRC